MNKEKYLGRKYSVQKYNQNWATQYQTEARALQKVLGASVISIEHIGSTSVKGLAGKPTIDVLVVVQEVKVIGRFEKVLESMGYKNLGAYVTEDSCLFVKEKDGVRLVNVHFFPFGHPHIDEMLGLRDHLRAHKELVREYSDLKFELIKKYPDDYDLYRKYKDKWMNALIKKIGLR